MSARVDLQAEHERRLREADRLRNAQDLETRQRAAELLRDPGHLDRDGLLVALALLVVQLAQPNPPIERRALDLARRALALAEQG